MDLTVVSPHFAPRFEGGTERVARAHARALAARGHAVRVVAGTETARAGLDVEEAVVDGLPVRFLPRDPEERYDLLLERPRLTALVRAETAGADLAHVHGWSTLSGDLVRALARERPVAVSLHDLFVTCPRFFRIPVAGVAACPPRGEVAACVDCCLPDAGGLDRAALRAGLVERARRWQEELDAAALVILPSEAHRARLETLVRLDPGRTRVVPHGLTQALDRGGAAGAWAGEGTLRVLHLGNLATAKGVLDLADAVALLGARARRVELVVAGRPVEAGIEAGLRERAGAARVHLLGGYGPDTLPAALASLGGCHLAVLPSRAYESYGLVVDEALALGLPVWVSDRGAPRERVGAAGRVLPAGDPAALARALEQVLDDPGVLARERAAVPAEVPAAAEAARVLEGLFESLLGETRAPRSG